MDSRLRPAKKRIRKKGHYITTTVKLDQDILHAVEKGLTKKPENNMSEYIEDITTPFLPPDGIRKRRWKTYPIKKTFTFTESYNKKIKITGNSSLALEELLIKALKLK